MKNKLITRALLKPLLCASAGFSLTFATCISAAPLTLSKVPLQATGKVEPNLMILMDSSGSMAWYVDHNYTADDPADSRLGIAKTAANTVVRGLGELRVGLAQFNSGDGAEILQGLTSISKTGARETLIKKINAIQAGGSTPIAEAVADVGRYFVEGYEGQQVTLHPGQTNESKMLAKQVLGGGPLYATGVTVPGTGSNSAIQEYCQSNFILALTDGIPNGDSARTTYLADYDGDGNSEGDDALDDVASALYDIDWRPDKTNPRNPDHKNNITSYFIGFADPALADNQLLKDAGAQGGGSYQFASSADSLLSSLNDAVNSISNSIGTQASVAFNSTSLDIGSVIYSAKFDTADFSGKLLARSLDPDTGRIASELWEASEELTKQTASSREIITYLNGKGVPFTADVSGVDTSSPDSPQELDLKVEDADGSTNDAAGLWQSRLAYIRGDNSLDGQSGLRQRGKFSTFDAVSGPKLLGDIVHSTPIYVGKPELDWPATFGKNNPYAQFAIDEENRTPMVYVGANDGMLHGFNANTGAEVFGYIPGLVVNSDRYAGLHAFTSDKYSHNYYVDLTPAVSDAYIDPKGGNQAEWTTVVVGGLRGGGKGYFALNVTDPSSINESNASDLVLWEFDGGDATDRANLGESYSEAQIAKLNNDEWAVIFGNGYNSDNGVAGLFIVYLEKGADGQWDSGDWKFISTGSGTVDGRKNGLSSPRLIDVDGDRVVDRVYAGDVMGNMWAFDLKGAESGWKVLGSKPLFTAGANAGQPNHAILGKPLVARNTAASNGTDPNLLVMFGTGQYLNGSDLTDNSAGAFYAVWDDDYTDSNSSLTVSDLAEQKLTSDGNGRMIDASTSTTVDWTQHHGWYMQLETGNAGAIDSAGYAGERVISGATLRRNTLFFSTVKPNAMPCASSGSGYLMSLDFRTGQAGDDGVADFNNDGSIDQKDAGYVGMEFNACIGGNCGTGDPGDDDPGMPGQSGFIGDVRCTPGSNGDVICDDIEVGDEEREGRLAWEELTPGY
ncbi:PilC/PilY family type IV pilus protein [Microbulbifer hainanensis]|uniref:PilC/PilY family type IV pilus protein n=1 Tax=Microbulbifer hainanensis TaxID=2735675 RepID=UPI0018685EB0|nr:PilC/PilY family type IV pilus protein [Microbulbifer hainanensis]